jgi:beta-1,4-mannosyl-glycoprotein beta-1,4-N-acetylglucosaminyltransferase
MKVIDCFTFYNELALLKYRLTVLNEVVDTFIIVEAHQTYMGRKKPLFYGDNKDAFKEFNSKIVHIVVDLPNTEENGRIDVKKNNQWVNERCQRDSIQNGLDSLTLLDNDIIIVSDLDEIPDPNTLAKIKANEIPIEINSLVQDMYYCNLRCILQYYWDRAKVCTFKAFSSLDYSCNELRLYECPPIPRGGWHLSYFGDKSFIENKLLNFSHQPPTPVDKSIIGEYVEKKLSSIYNIKSNTTLTDMIFVDTAQNKYLPPSYETLLADFL